MVFKAMKNIVMVPLDVTMSHTFEEADRLKLLSAENRFVQAIGQMLERYIQFYINTYGRKACALHDPVAAVLAVQGIGACLAPNVKVTIDDSDGPGRGQTPVRYAGAIYELSAAARCQLPCGIKHRA